MKLVYPCALKIRVNEAIVVIRSIGPSELGSSEDSSWKYSDIYLAETPIFITIHNCLNINFRVSLNIKDGRLRSVTFSWQWQMANDFLGPKEAPSLGACHGLIRPCIWKVVGWHFPMFGFTRGLGAGLVSWQREFLLQFPLHYRVLRVKQWQCAYQLITEKWQYFQICLLGL